jgi:3-hydroxyisobutyrate dehydrogenase-like beta-hydroxyacid dehydrogenase
MDNAKDAAPVVAIIGAGEMGAAVGQRLQKCGAGVLTSLKGRGSQSVERVRKAGLEIVDDDDQLVARADFVLSIVPPASAMEVARRFYGPLAQSGVHPVFADCNAISPKTVKSIAEVLTTSGCRFVDAGIIGGPPSNRDSSGPRFYASGADAGELARLSGYGLDIAPIDGPIGAASALKLSYAGITKGLIAIGAAMVAGASRAGTAELLRAELMRTQPDLVKRFERHLPSMLPKAYRWVAEMEEIAEFLGDDSLGAPIYHGASALYQRIATEVAALETGEKSDTLAALRTFCKV